MIKPGCTLDVATKTPSLYFYIQRRPGAQIRRNDSSRYTCIHSLGRKSSPRWDPEGRGYTGEQPNKGKIIPGRGRASGRGQPQSKHDKAKPSSLFVRCSMGRAVYYRSKPEQGYTAALTNKCSIVSFPVGRMYVHIYRINKRSHDIYRKPHYIHTLKSWRPDTTNASDKFRPRVHRAGAVPFHTNKKKKSTKKTREPMPLACSAIQRVIYNYPCQVLPGYLPTPRFDNK